MTVRKSKHGAPRKRRGPGFLFGLSGAVLALTLVSCKDDEDDPEEDPSTESGTDSGGSDSTTSDGSEDGDDKPEDDSDKPEDESDKPEDESDKPEDESDKPEDESDKPEDESDKPEDESDKPEDDSEKPEKRDCDKIKWGPRVVEVGGIIARGEGSKGYADKDGDNKPEEEETAVDMCQLHLTGKKCGLINYGAG